MIVPPLVDIYLYPNVEAVQENNIEKSIAMLGAGKLFIRMLGVARATMGVRRTSLGGGSRGVLRGGWESHLASNIVGQKEKRPSVWKAAL
jgi:hypothetical protein